jgi:hypothetical protein
MISRVLTYLLFLQIGSIQFLPGGYFGQLLIIDNLLDHWDLHQTADPEIKFSDFILEHFVPLTEHKEQHSHEKLPFHDIAIAHFSFIEVPSLNNVLFDKDSSFINIIELNQLFISFYNGNGVYHPPC